MNVTVTMWHAHAFKCHPTLVYLHSFHMPVAMEMAAHEMGWSIKTNYIFHTHSSEDRAAELCDLQRYTSNNLYWTQLHYEQHKCVYMYENMIFISDRLLRLPSIYLHF